MIVTQLRDLTSIPSDKHAKFRLWFVNLLIPAFMNYQIALLIALLLVGMGWSKQANGQDRAPNARLVYSGPASAPAETRSRRAAPATGQLAHATVPVFAADTLERQAFELINAQRVARGEGPLIWDDELCAMAREHSTNMARRGFFDHDDPEGNSTVDRARSRGIRGWQALAENIEVNQGYENPAAFAIERWMNSPKHRFNILYSDFNRSAVGVARTSDGQILFTQVFMSRK